MLNKFTQKYSHDKMHLHLFKIQCSNLKFVKHFECDK